MSKIEMFYSTMANCHMSIWLLILLFAGASSKRINLSPYAIWNQNGITIAGWANGTKGSSPSQLNRPLDISITTDDVLYISDMENHRIVVVPLNAEKDQFTIGPTLDTGASQFNQPYGLSITNTSLYVIDLGNRRVQKLSLNGTNATTVPGLSGLASPYYLYVDGDSNIYLSDTYNHSVLLFYHNSTNGTIVAGVGTNGIGNNQLNRPYGVFVTQNHTIYVADTDNHRIMKWLLGASLGICTAGNGTHGPSSTQLYLPTQILVDTNEYMYISEAGNHRITRWASNSTFGECIVGCSGTSGIASNQLFEPHSLAFDSNGSLYVCDYGNHRVQKFEILNCHTLTILYEQPKIAECVEWHSNATTFLNTKTTDLILLGILFDENHTMNTNSMYLPSQIVVQNNNDTSSNNSFMNLARVHDLLVTRAGDIHVDRGFLKDPLYEKSSYSIFDRSYRQHILHTCTNLFIDITNSIYCSKSQNHSVVRISYNDTVNELISSYFGSGTDRSTSDSFKSPSGLFVDSQLNLYVADTGNHRIQRFENGSKNATTVAGNTLLAGRRLRFPTAVVVDNHGYLFIVDCGNHRIIRSDSNGFRCIVGCSQMAGSAMNQLQHPRILWFDTSGNMFVLDQDNHRIQKFALQTSFPTETFASCSVPLTCWNPQRMGLRCDFSTRICDLQQPCQHHSTCINSDNNQNYTCQCAPDFNGINCEFDHRPCKPDICHNDGTCDKSPEMVFNCTCAPGWYGRYCEEMINYCRNITCENRGVCQRSLLNFSCQCLSGYSGRYCEVTARRLIIYRIVSKSFAYVAIIAMATVVTFVVIMDILKYGFGIDPVEEERKRIQREKQAKKRSPVIERVVYVNPPAAELASKRRLSTILETPA